MFYGVVQEEYLFEFDFKGAIDTIKKKIKNAISAFINKIEELLNKGKDNKIKSALRSLLNKVKKLFGLVDKAKEKEELENITKELNEYKDEMDKIENQDRKNKAYKQIRSLAKDIYNGKTTALKVAKRIKEIVNKYGTTVFYRFPIDKDEFPKPWNKDTLEELKFLETCGGTSINFYLFFAQVADEVYNH